MRKLIQILFLLPIIILIIIYSTTKFYQQKNIGKIISCENKVKLLGKTTLNSKTCKNYKLYYNDVIITNGKTVISINGKQINLSSGSIIKIKPDTTNIVEIFLLIGEMLFTDKNNNLNIKTPSQQLILKGDILSLKSEISGKYLLINIKNTNKSESIKYLIKKNNLKYLYNYSRFKSDILQKLDSIENLIILDEN